MAKESESDAQELTFQCLGCKNVSVWQMIICLKQESKTIPCICICLIIILYPTYYICLHVKSSPWTQHGGFCYMLGNPLESQDCVNCLGKIQLLVLVMWCCLKHAQRNIWKIPIEFESRLSKCHTIYTSIISDQKLCPKEILDTPNKYKLPAHFSKAKFTLPPCIPQIYLLFSKFSPIYFNLLTMLMTKCQYQKNLP